MVSKERVNMTKEKFATLLGGFDETGKEHRLARDPKDVPAAQNRHLFAVKNKDSLSSAWHFVRGGDAYTKIDEDYWEIVYMGRADKCSYIDADGKEHITNKVYAQYLIKQAEDLVEGVKRRDLRQDIIREEAYYKNLLKEKTDAINAKIESKKE